MSGIAAFMAASGLGQAAGDLASSALAAHENRRSARSQMYFQKNMSDTAHQREVRDLRAAGLNPILSAGGGGSSTPSGAGYTMPDAKLGTSASMGASAHNARAIQKQELENLAAQNQLTVLQGEKTDQEKYESMSRERVNNATEKQITANTALAVAQEMEARARIPTYAVNMAKTKEETRGTAADANVKEWYSKKATALNPFLDMLLDEVLTPIANSAREKLRQQKQEGSWSGVLAPGGLHVLKKKLHIK